MSDSQYCHLETTKVRPGERRLCRSCGTMWTGPEPLSSYCPNCRSDATIVWTYATDTAVLVHEGQQTYIKIV